MYACVCLLLGRAEHLHDDGVAAGERGPQLPGLHHQREVPVLSSSVTPAADQPATLLLTELMFHGTGRQSGKQEGKNLPAYLCFQTAATGMYRGQSRHREDTALTMG